MTLQNSVRLSSKLFHNELMKSLKPSSTAFLFTTPHYLVLLNSDTFDIHMTKTLWNKFQYKICADGGANQLYDKLNTGPDKTALSKYLPDFITGDLDSLRDDVREYYKAHNVEILLNEDQNYNDYDKSLQLAQKLAMKSKVEYDHSVAVPVAYESDSQVTIVTFGAFGGRFDQEICSIHALFKWKHCFKNIMLIDKFNVAFLLHANVINLIRPIMEVEGPTCSLLPLGSAVRKVWSKGLKWNLSGNELRMGGLISSSNSIECVSAADITTNESVADIETLYLLSCTSSGSDSRIVSSDGTNPADDSNSDIHHTAITTIPTATALVTTTLKAQVNDICVISTDDLIFTWSLPQREIKVN